MFVGQEDVLADLFFLLYPITPHPFTLPHASIVHLANVSEILKKAINSYKTTFMLIKIKALFSNMWNIQQFLLSAWHAPKLKKGPVTHFGAYDGPLKAFFKHKTTPSWRPPYVN